MLTIRAGRRRYRKLSSIRTGLDVARVLQHWLDMNIDITAEHVAMRPEWHDMIDGWLRACRRRHPDLQGLDLRIRHEDSEPAGEAVDLIALARGRSLRATTHATDMSVALCDAFETLEHELTLNEAIRPRTDRRQ